MVITEGGHAVVAGNPSVLRLPLPRECLTVLCELIGRQVRDWSLEVCELFCVLNGALGHVQFGDGSCLQRTVKIIGLSATPVQI